MPKHIIEFNLPEEREELATTLKATDMSLAIWEISNEVFRPARKHGYSNKSIQTLLEKLGEDGTELVSLLENSYYEILNKYEVNEG